VPSVSALQHQPQQVIADMQLREQAGRLHFVTASDQILELAGSTVGQPFS